MCFYASGYNFGLKGNRDEPNKPLNALRLAECDSNGKDVQYNPNDLSFEKPSKISASKVSTSKTPTSPSHGIIGKTSDPTDQMTDDSITLDVSYASRLMHVKDGLNFLRIWLYVSVANHIP